MFYRIYVHRFFFIKKQIKCESTSIFLKLNIRYHMVLLFKKYVINLSLLHHDVEYTIFEIIILKLKVFSLYLTCHSSTESRNKVDRFVFPHFFVAYQNCKYTCSTCCTKNSQHMTCYNCMTFGA